MDDGQLTDLKQFITATVSQQIAEADILRRMDQRLDKKIDTLDRVLSQKLDNLSLAMGEALDTTNSFRILWRPSRLC